MISPLVFNIIRCSTVDGPGVRTTLFFKGCNLDCKWCHNPEGKSPHAQLAFFAEKCVSCGACSGVCDNPDKCIACGKCADVCKTGARKVYGKQMRPEEIFSIIAKDKLFYDACGGGATFSGGECMLYPDFLAQCAALCQENGISVAVDTAGNVPFASFEKILPQTDIFLYDIKCITPEKHKKFTGADNKLILANFEKLLKTDKRVIVRVPVIDYFNGDEQEMSLIRQYLADKNVEVEYLPYHDMGESKKQALEKF